MGMAARCSGPAWMEDNHIVTGQTCVFSVFVGLPLSSFTFSLLRSTVSGIVARASSGREQLPFWIISYRKLFSQNTKLGAAKIPRFGKIECKSVILSNHAWSLLLAAACRKIAIFCSPTFVSHDAADRIHCLLGENWNDIEFQRQVHAAVADTPRDASYYLCVVVLTRKKTNAISCRTLQLLLICCWEYLCGITACAIATSCCISDMPN